MMTTGERLVKISTLSIGTAMEHFLNISTIGVAAPPIQLPGEIIYVYNNYKVSYLGYIASKIRYVSARSFPIKFTSPPIMKISFKEASDMKVVYKEVKDIKVKYIEPVINKIDDICKQ